MTSTIKKRFPFFSLMEAKNYLSIIENRAVHTSTKTFDLFLGVLSALVALPLVTLTILLSIFLPQEQWEEFWDEFLEK